MKLLLVTLALIALFYAIMATDDHITDSSKLVELQTHFLPTNPDKKYETIIAEVSAYTLNADECDSDFCISASGLDLCRNRGAWIACPRFIPFGTIIGINDKSYVCVDRMGRQRIDGNYFDILMNTKQEALNWGRQKLSVKIFNN